MVKSGHSLLSIKQLTHPLNFTQQCLTNYNMTKKISNMIEERHQT